MINIVEYISIAGVSAGALVLLLALLFADQPRSRPMRVFAIGLAMVAIGLPMLHLGTTLGRATPWLTPGVYTVHGWKTLEDARRIYVMVAQPDQPVAQQFEIPWNPEIAAELQDFRHSAVKLEKLCLMVRPPESEKTEISVFRVLGRRYGEECPAPEF